ncbi:hypothetical protein MXD63_25935 [Frankia sp. Cpl3]|nr:hypothetical protein [Frankia sp. Cpl3]
MGAVLGEHALPQDWVCELEGFEIVERVTDDLVREIDRTRSVSDKFGAAPQGSMPFSLFLIMLLW